LNTELYNEAYYKSNNYQTYLDRASKYEKLSKEMHNFLQMINLSKGPVLDFGCAVGFVSQAMINLGYDVDCVDISDWARNECRKKNLKVYKKPNYNKQYGITFALDVLEHLTPDELNLFMDNIKTNVMIVRVPICLENEDDYYFPEARSDTTHIIKWSHKQWDSYIRSKNYHPIELNLSTIYCSPGGYCALCISTSTKPQS
jgi:hypothetical protein